MRSAGARFAIGLWMNGRLAVHVDMSLAAIVAAIPNADFDVVILPAFVQCVGVRR